MEPEEYFKLTHYIADSPLPSKNYTIGDIDEVRNIASYVSQGAAADNFSCPNYQTLRFNVNDVVRGQSEVKLPFVEVLPNDLRVRLGYSYVAGFETETWDWPSLTMGVKWTSPRRKTDRGSLVVMSDRNRWCQQLPDESIVTHAKGKGFVQGIEGDPREEYGDADTNIGYLDGSVKSAKLRNLQPRTVTNLGRASSGLYR